MTGPDPAPPARPTLALVKGGADAEEIAAVVTAVHVLAAAAQQARPAPTPRRPAEWSAPHRRLRVAYPQGPGGWRSSGLPRPR